MSINQLLIQANQNPESPETDSLRLQIEAWEWDSELKAEGIDLPWRPLSSIPKTRPEFASELAWETFAQAKTKLKEWWEAFLEDLNPFRWAKEIKEDIEGRGFISPTLRVLGWAWKVLESWVAWLAWLAAPEIQKAVELIPDSVKETFADLEEKFDKLPKEIQWSIWDLFDSFNLLSFAPWLLTKTWVWAKEAVEAAGLAWKKAKVAETVKDIWTAWKAAEGLIWSTLKLNRTDIDRFKRFSWGKSPSRFLLDKDLAKWSKETIAQETANFAKNKFDELNESVSWIKGTHQNGKFTQAFDSLLSNVEWVPWLEDKLADLIKLKAKHDSTWLDLSEVLELKRKIDQDADIFTVAWEVKAAKQKEWLANIRKNIKEFIEDEASKTWVDVKELSNDIQLSTEIKQWLAKIINREESNNIFWLMDWIITAWTAWTLWLEAAAVAFIGKKVLDNPSLRNSVARWLNSLDDITKTKLLRKNLKFTPVEIQAIQDVINKAEEEWWEAITDFETGKELPQLPAEILE